MTDMANDSRTGGFSEHEVLELARQAYAGEAVFPIERERTALLVIDMQDEFVRAHWTPFWVPDATRLVPGIRRLVDACRRLEVPVIYTAFARTHGYRDRPRSGASMPNRYREVAANPEWFRDGTIWRELAPAERSSSTSRRTGRSTTRRCRRS
jgi:isochorismate hydrolase